MSADTDFVVAASSVVQLVISAGGLLLVFGQLKKMTEANNKMAEANKKSAEATEIAAQSAEVAAQSASLSAAMAVVQLEETIYGARDKLAQLSLEIAVRSTETEFVQANALRHNELIEGYLNRTDRLCSYIQQGWVDEELYRADFRQFLVEIVGNYKDRFGPDTQHRHILEVHTEWARDKSARLVALKRNILTS